MAGLFGWFGLFSRRRRKGEYSEGVQQVSWKQRFELYRREERERPEYWKSHEVDAELWRDVYFERKEGATEEDAIENAALAERIKGSGMMKFLLRCEEIAAQENAEAVSQNALPYRKEDAALWKKLPLVPGPYDGAPMPRLALKGTKDARNRFWDFFKQFQFGLWGYRQRPYPPQKPIDVQQALGYKWLDKRYFDFVMRSGSWYYKDRLGRTRGPMELVNLKTAWAAGIVDKNTFIWGDDMDEWAPIGMVYGLETAIATPDIRLVTAGTDLLYKLGRGLSLWGPKKGHEYKSYKQLQREAIDRREREKAVMRLNGGVWPGERAPSHSLFLWASGSELTTLLEEGTAKSMPDKFIPYDVRKKLAEEIPGLRPWEVLDIEELMDFATFSGEWFREDLGSFTTRADYERDWFEDFKEDRDYLLRSIENRFESLDRQAARNILARMKLEKRKHQRMQ